jgi:predicted Ser/Thr protein kinase
MQPSKKRIGPYSYRLADVIGSGFSSTVYKGYKDNDKSQVVALKVVKITDMKDHRRKLLENEVKILK